MTGAATTAERGLLERLAIILCIGLPLVVLTLGVVGLSAMLCYDLVRRGLSESHASWTVLGLAVGAVWLLMLGLTLRRKRR